MRTVEIKTNGKTIVVLDLPTIATNVKVDFLFPECPRIHYGNQWGGVSTERLRGYNGIEPIGFASSLSEKEWAGIVETVKAENWDSPAYLNYKDHISSRKDCFITSTESGKSWLEANGIADFVNPFLLIKK